MRFLLPKNYLKIIAINFTVLLVILFSPALLLRIYRIFNPFFARTLNETSDKRAYYPTYENKKFSIELLNEYQDIPKTNYRSFVGWKRGKVNLKYTNISGPYNARKSTGEGINNSTWFFGGSTMWGNGASDSQTIPSHFNSITTNPVYNFGETSWNSRQSLNQLINVIGDEHQPSVVIFYDGVNDVLHQCRSENKLLPSHSREKYFQNKLKGLPIIKRISNTILYPYIIFTNKFSIPLPAINKINSKFYDCDINQAKAFSIARHLVNNWRTAYLLSKSKGFKFYGILQPTLFTTKTNSEYFPSDEVNKNSRLKIQYSVVYPLIIEEMDKQCKLDNEFCLSMINGTKWLDEKNNVFIDHAHINSLGNKVIAQRLKSLLKK